MGRVMSLDDLRSAQVERARKIAEARRAAGLYVFAGPDGKPVEIKVVNYAEQADADQAKT